MTPRRRLTEREKALEAIAQAIARLPEAEHIGQAVARRAALNRALVELSAWRERHKGHPEYAVEFRGVDAAICRLLRSLMEGGHQ